MSLLTRLASSIGLALLLSATAMSQSASTPVLLNWGNDVTVAGITYFAASDVDHGIELWRSDGTAAGTWLVADVNAGPTSSYPTDLVVAGGWIYFTADDGQHGTELWRTDGTTQNTAMVADIAPGILGSNPFFLTALGPKVYFQATTAEAGSELWVSDGTAPGTTLLADLAEGPQSSFPSELTAFGDAIYFTADDGLQGRELWVAEGAPGGSVLLKELNPSGSSFPSYFTVAAGRLFFVANNGRAGAELWAVGADSSITIVQDINPGSADSFPTELISAGPLLYFVADDGVHGRQVWRSDGTGDGTFRVSNVEPSSSTLEPFHLQLSQGRVLFRARNGTDLVTWLSDGTEQGALPLGSPQFGSATVFWQPPTINVDGSPLVGLAGYRVYFGRDRSPLLGVIEITDPGVTSLEIRNLLPGMNFFAVTAFTDQQLESDRSTIGSKDIAAAP